MSADNDEQQCAGSGGQPHKFVPVPGKPPLTKIFVIQIILLVLLSTALLLVDRTVAKSSLIGGSIAIGSNWYFARWAFRYAGAKAARQVAHSFYVGETGKFLLTVVLFAASFAVIRPLNTVSIFSTYLLMVLVNGVLSAWFCGTRGRQKTES